jgi:hypothetical protein
MGLLALVEIEGFSQRHGAMNMRALETNLLVNTERISLVVVCLLSAGFMVWFLIALLLDGRRARARRSFPLERITIQRDRQSENWQCRDTQTRGGAINGTNKRRCADATTSKRLHRLTKGEFGSIWPRGK